MSPSVKQTLRDWIAAIDNSNPLEKLSKQEKEERMFRIKSAMNMLNSMEKNSVFTKLKVMYPLGHVDQKIRQIPIKFKNDL
jgi:hypothetical protein